MNFEIPVETYIRLAGVSRYIRSDISDHERHAIKCVRVEHKKGHTYAVASNRKIGAIYHIGVTTEPDAAIHLDISEALLKQCEIEKAFNSKLHIVAIRELSIISLKTTMGFQLATAGFFTDVTPLANWDTWVPNTPVTQTKGAMAWVTDDMMALNAASPSGRIVFPEFIDASKPVILRDMNFPDWIGMFMGNLLNDKGKPYTVEPATLPAWW